MFPWRIFILVRAMLYGFGDVENPLPETVALVEELATQYIFDMVGLEARKFFKLVLFL